MFTSTFLSQFDAFAKPLKDFRVKTIAGAIVSIFSCLSIMFLFISEFFLYLTPQMKQEIMVDVNRGEKLFINLDITYLHIPCVMLNLDTMDATGEEQIDVHHEVYKTPVDTHGVTLSPSVRHDVNRPAVSVPEKQNSSVECGSCYGAESETRKLVSPVFRFAPRGSDFIVFRGHARSQDLRLRPMDQFRLFYQ
ncbi:Endoplasmic reticulum-Golgi intermediate compartment protein 3 [Fasciola hepatica]|uniref:Endoplasmic reticulum-Golgi intermediate compartment protein 3 n=1 Tax=Fasciola hepatica TaxID=6192 RepID=A0A4E0QV11_FASHE|nr:Endoplasmic reticulum-Golgi intermediate compartment protein 3 [Fasciola hepatica]